MSLALQSETVRNLSDAQCRRRARPAARQLPRAMKTISLLLCCCLPLKHLHLNSAYGNRVHPITRQSKFHNGIDLKAHNDTVYAISAGQAP
jgi:murein DD-endopeptidase MepM/ murein hydrolase activator NlpD